MAASLTLQVDGLAETQRALDAVAEDLARHPSQADRLCATGLAAKLAQAAMSCGVPVAPRAAAAIRPKENAVAIGPTQGRRGKPAYSLTWGSERGGRNFAAGVSSGYWIKPTVDAFKTGQGLLIYERGIAVSIGKAGF